MRLKKLYICATVLLLGIQADAQSINVQQKLKGFDKTIEKVLKDWNVPGCGIGIVVKDKLVFANGYGFRNLEQKTPVTPNTLFHIASNTKLFTATAIGFLVDEGKLDWDKPIKQYVPQIQFYNDELNSHVTIRDMLSHRTGISRHDNIWYQSDFSRQELFDRIKYLEPSLPLRQGYLYNNLMYGAAGSIIEYISSQTWEEFVEARIFKPLGMKNSLFLTEDMIKQSDFITSYYEKRDTTLLSPYPFYTKFQGVGPCGSIISNINDMSRWLITQINGGKYNKVQVIPNRIILETLQPASLTASVPDTYFENLNSIYGMGRGTSVYKGHYRTQHGGAIGGIYSNVSFMPADSIGVIVFTNGAHAGQLPGIITNMVYDKLLNLGETPWSDRALTQYLKNKETNKEARKKPDSDRVTNTQPSHPLTDYAGSYEDAAYGILKVNYSENKLGFTFNNTTLPLDHYYYDRFVSPDDEIGGKWFLAFQTDAQGGIDQVKVSLDEKEVTFLKKADPKFSDHDFLKKLTGQYELNSNTLNLVLSNKTLIISSSPPLHLDPAQNNAFRIREFSDQIIEFKFDTIGMPTGLNFTFDGKTLFFTRKK